MISKSLILAMILVESGGNPNAVSSKGAQGLLQLMPIGVQEVQNQYGLPVPANILDPETNILYGVRLLQYYYSTSGSIKGAVITYNGGFRAYLLWRAKLPIPQETEDYVRRVLKLRWEVDPMFQRILPETRSPMEYLIDTVFEN